MKKNNAIILGIIIVVATAIFMNLSDSKATDIPKAQPSRTQENVVDKNMAKVSITQGEANKTLVANDISIVANVGSYESYSAEKITRAESGKVVLFFHASWCPSCRALNGDIEKNASAIPNGITILKLDYDQENELKKKYGVTSQHTLVQVDKDGTMLKKWSGGSKLENLLSEIQ